MSTPTAQAEVWHAVVDGLTVPASAIDARPGTYGGGRVLNRGDEVDRQALVDATADRFGESWASDLSDEAQRARWGQVFLRKGTLEADRKLVHELEAEAAREAARVAQEALLLAHRYGRRERPIGAA